SAEVLGRDVAFPAAERLEAERAGEPAGRVDGQHHGASPFERAPERERRGHRRLADAAATGRDDDLVARDQLAERHGRSADTAARSGAGAAGENRRWWTRFTITDPTGIASGPTSSA